MIVSEGKNYNCDGAKFSDCRKYRYALWRVWDQTKPLIMFVGLNPSSANEQTDDPTIRRVKRFAADWGYGGLYMLNLFAYVTPYPDKLKQCGDPLAENDVWLDRFSKDADKIIFCWGAFDVFGRDKEVIKMFPNAYCLGKSKSGSPKHPLYLPASTVPIKFNS